MPISSEKKEKISLQVIKVLVTRFEKFPESSTINRNAPFHDAFLNAFTDKFRGNVSNMPFFISLSSWMHGLNTTLGQTFFEKVANILFDGEKREYTSKKLGNLQIARQQKDNVNTLITELSNDIRTPNLVYENEQIFLVTQENLVNAIDFSADVFREDETNVTAIELKSVKPNSGEVRGEKQKILEGKAALYKLFPEKNIRFFMGFPFDPTSNENPVGSDKARFMRSIINMNKYFGSDEVLLAGEFWDFLSQDNNTMQELLEIINSIATTEFIDRYRFILNQANKNEHLETYMQYLRNWNLYSELLLVNNETLIKRAILNNNRLTSKYNQLIFNDDAKYNKDRFLALNALLVN